MTTTYQRSYLPHGLLGLILLLQGCATPVQKAGEHHRSAAEKWYALSQYTASQLPLYGFTVTAKLAVAAAQVEKPTLVLTEISLQPKADSFRLNLLVPSFEQKYICAPQCMQLVEYSALQGEDANTLLTKYLDLYEFELFKFYGEMFVLNDALRDLNKENSQFLSEYLSYLSNQSDDFSSLHAFTDFLKVELGLKAYREFVNDSQMRYKNSVEQFLSKQQQLASGTIFRDERADSLWTDDLKDSPDVNWNTLQDNHDANWTIETLNDDPRQSWDITGTLSEMAAMSLFTVVQPAASQWLEAKQSPLKIGAMVCSFHDNYFGIIQSVSLNQLEVFVQGQAKKTLDGIVTDLVSGSLFTESSGTAFMPMAEKMTFSRTDIAPCNIQ